MLGFLTSLFSGGTVKAIENIASEAIETEMESAEARAFSADANAVTPLMDGLIVARGLGETKADLATKIIANADAYAIGYAQVLGAYQAKLKAIA